MAYQVVLNGSENAVLRQEIMIQSANDLADIPASAAVGSVAYTADYAIIYTKAIDGTWTRLGGVS
jgi:hypothetical protein